MSFSAKTDCIHLSTHIATTTLLCACALTSRTLVLVLQMLWDPLVGVDYGDSGSTVLLVVALVVVVGAGVVRVPCLVYISL